MNRLPTPLCLAVGVLFLTLGLCLPWVKLDSMTTRWDNLGKVTGLLENVQLPEIISNQLEDYRIKPGVTPQELWSALATGRHARNFEGLQDREYLFVWHFFRLDVAWPSKLVLILLIVWYVVSIFYLFGQNTTWSALSAYIHNNNEDDHDYEHRARYQRPPLPITALLLIFFFFRLPYWDTLGYVGNWSMSLLDVLVGGRVAFAPRLLVPAGLLLIMLANLESFMNGLLRTSDLDTYE